MYSRDNSPRPQAARESKAPRVDIKKRTPEQTERNVYRSQYTPSRERTSSAAITREERNPTPDEETARAIPSMEPPPDYGGTVFPYHDSDIEEDDAETPSESGKISYTDEENSETDDEQPELNYPPYPCFECDEFDDETEVVYSSGGEKDTEAGQTNAKSEIDVSAFAAAAPFIVSRRAKSDDKQEVNETDGGDLMNLLKKAELSNISGEDMLLAALIVMLLTAGAEEEMILILAFLLLSEK